MQDEITPSAEQLAECKVCGKSMIAITNTHLKKHDMTCAEYKKKFPDSSMGDFSRFQEWRSSEENKVHCIEMNRKVFSTPEIRDRRAASLLATMKTQEYRQRLSHSLKAYAQTPEAKKRFANMPKATDWMKLSNYEKWRIKYGVEEANRRQLDWQSKNIIPSASRNTKPERKMAELLRELGFEFEQQFELPRAYCDFYLPQINLIIEVDGDYWHANPNRFKPTDQIGMKKKTAQQV